MLRHYSEDELFVEYLRLKNELHDMNMKAERLIQAWMTQPSNTNMRDDLTKAIKAFAVNSKKGK